MLEKWEWPNGQHSRAGNSTTEGFETANANQGLDQGHISPLFLHSTIWPYIRAEMHRPQLATNSGPDRPGNGAQLNTYQRWEQLSRVPHFEILRFRWGSTSSTQKPVSDSPTKILGDVPFASLGLACLLTATSQCQFSLDFKQGEWQGLHSGQFLSCQTRTEEQSQGRLHM